MFDTISVIYLADLFCRQDYDETEESTSVFSGSESVYPMSSRHIGSCPSNGYISVNTYVCEGGRGRGGRREIFFIVVTLPRSQFPSSAGLSPVELKVDPCEDTPKNQHQPLHST